MDSPRHAGAPGYVPSLPKISDAKITEISQKLKRLNNKIDSGAPRANELIYSIADAIGIKRASSSRSNYTVGGAYR